MARAYTTGPLSAGATVLLSAEESHHLVDVLRLKETDPVTVFDGTGKVARGKIIKIVSKKVSVEIESIEQNANRPKITLAFAYPKSKALDFMVHRCTEVGVGAFQPLVTQHSIKVTEWNIDRWSKVTKEVCKQCEEDFLPTFLDPMPLPKWLSMRMQDRALVVCDEQDRSKRVMVTGKPQWDLLVGCEGGWSRDEVELIKSHGAQFMGLGRNRLRAETAALSALILLKREIGEI